MSNPFRILYKYPSRNRPDRFFQGLDTITNLSADKEWYHVACTLDLDDSTMNNESVIKRIESYPNTSIQWGISKSKIHAVNRDMPDYPFDILINFSDDMRFNLYGYDQCVRVDMNAHFPNFEGLLHYPDQDAKEYLATMYIAGRKFYDTFGFIYDPEFKSLWCDNLVQSIAQHMGRYKYCGYQINTHLNPAYGHLEKDEMFLEQQGHWGHDELVYRRIINEGLDNYILKFLTK